MGLFEGEEVPLDFPMYAETLEVKKKKKDPPIGKPTRNTGSGKKYKCLSVTKTGKIKKITYGDSKVVLGRLEQLKHGRLPHAIGVLRRKDLTNRVLGL